MGAVGVAFTHASNKSGPDRHEIGIRLDAAAALVLHRRIQDADIHSLTGHFLG
jgi:hypothetical protein